MLIISSPPLMLNNAHHGKRWLVNHCHPLLKHFTGKAKQDRHTINFTQIPNSSYSNPRSPSSPTLKNLIFPHEFILNLKNVNHKQPKIPRSFFSCISCRPYSSSLKRNHSFRGGSGRKQLSLTNSQIPNKEEGSSLHSSIHSSPKLQLAVETDASTKLIDQVPNLNSNFMVDRLLNSEANSMDAHSVVLGRESINITNKEESIFAILLETTTFFNLETQLRVAGGWVRDKLLGKECYDIDIALDNMVGKEFAEKVNEYLKTKGEKEVTIGVIQSNPEQSKHLETATMNIHGFLIDLVNLRSETYAEHSRIPIMKFGSPLEDALRRDLTINSLFYNINNQQIEDFTGKGLDDLKNGLIRTPLPAQQTFLDDPLRVLRAIRFGSRFGFKLDDDIIESAKNEQVIQALATKISRERIGKEIDLMLHGKNPSMAMNNLYILKLFSSIFCLPKVTIPTIDFDYAKACVDSLDETLSIVKNLNFENSEENENGLFLCFFSAFLLPLKDISFYEKKNKLAPVSLFIIRDSLKLKNAYAENVLLFHKAATDFQFLGNSYFVFSDAEKTKNARVTAGRALMSAKKFWKHSLPLAALLSEKTKNDSSAIEEASRKAPDGNASSDLGTDSEPILKRKRSSGSSGSEWCEIVEKSILDLGLDGVWETKPLLTGKEIMNILSLKNGPSIGEYVDKVKDWQLANPNLTKEECEAWLRSNFVK